MQVLRGVEDSKAFEKGLNNTTTARGPAGAARQDRARRAPSTRRATARWSTILKRQKFNDAIPAGLPPGTPVAHKTGNITRIHHDAAIVYGPNPYVLVVLVRGIEDKKQSAALMAELSRAVYESADRAVIAPRQSRKGGAASVSSSRSASVRSVQSVQSVAQKTYTTLTIGNPKNAPMPTGNTSPKSAETRSPKRRTPPETTPFPSFQT